MGRATFASRSFALLLHLCIVPTRSQPPSPRPAPHDSPASAPCHTTPRTRTQAQIEWSAGGRAKRAARAENTKPIIYFAGARIGTTHANHTRVHHTAAMAAMANFGLLADTVASGYNMGGAGGGAASSDSDSSLPRGFGSGGESDQANEGASVQQPRKAVFRKASAGKAARAGGGAPTAKVNTHHRVCVCVCVPARAFLSLSGLRAAPRQPPTPISAKPPSHLAKRSPRSG